MAEGTDCSRKRPVSLEPKLCLICQKDNKQKLMTVNSDGFHSVDYQTTPVEITQCNYRDATDRLTEILQADSPQPFLWHKDCRSNYMSQCKVERLRKGPFAENLVTCTSTEKFICKMYGVPEVDTCNKARVKLFCIGRAHETLPPTSDACS